MARRVRALREAERREDAPHGRPPGGRWRVQFEGGRRRERLERGQHLGEDALLRDVAAPLPARRHLTLARPPVAGEHPQQAALARARGADDGRQLSAREVTAQIEQKLFFACVKINIFQIKTLNIF